MVADEFPLLLLVAEFALAADAADEFFVMSDVAAAEAAGSAAPEPDDVWKVSSLSAKLAAFRRSEMFLVDSLPSGSEVMLARFFADDLWPMKRLYSLVLVRFVAAAFEAGPVPLLSRLLLAAVWGLVDPAPFLAE